MEPVHLVQANAGSAAARPLSDWLPQLDAARPAGAYVHVPFCFHKCHYCDFYSFVDTRDRQEAFVERLLAEARVMAGLVREPLRTLFVGGGTPTLLTDERLARLLRGLRAVDPFTPRTTHLRSAGDPLGGGLFIAASVLLAAYAAVLVSRDQRAANVVTTTVCVAWCHCVRRVCTELFIIAECAECAECAEFV